MYYCVKLSCKTKYLPILLCKKFRSLASSLCSIENERFTEALVGWHCCNAARLTADLESSMMALTSEFLFIFLAMQGMTLALSFLKSSLLMSLCASRMLYFELSIFLMIVVSTG